MGLSHYATRWERRYEQIKDGRALARIALLERGCDWQRYWSPLIEAAIRPALIPMPPAK